jgi:hypothetical protein
MLLVCLDLLLSVYDRKGILPIEVYIAARRLAFTNEEMRAALLLRMITNGVSCERLVANASNMSMTTMSSSKMLQRNSRIVNLKTFNF